MATETSQPEPAVDDADAADSNITDEITQYFGEHDEIPTAKLAAHAE